MHFSLIDKITQLQAGETIVATKTLSFAEEYLRDHFPLFPVMPGVLMLESLTQAGAWLIRATEDFAHSVIVLQQARNVKYVDFVEPGSVLAVHVDWVKREDDLVHMRARGAVDGRSAVTARLVLETYNLADKFVDGHAQDVSLVNSLHDQWSVLWRPAKGDETPAGDG